MPAGCGRRPGTQQISRKRTYKTLDLRGHKTLMAITPPAGPFFAITRKEVTRNVKLPARPCTCWLINAEEFPKSFGGRLAQIREIQAWNPTRRAWSSTEEFAFRGLVGAPLQAQSGKRAPSPRAFFAGRGRGEWGNRAAGERFGTGTVCKLYPCRILLVRRVSV
jgi:hypothetical protein